jgi:glyoxylase-like metal-dependent hydrolase (beta-lactamase superfamily II)
MGSAYEIYAIRYATMSPRTPHMNHLVPDPHETSAQDLDYFVWLIRGGGRDILVDTGFNAAEAKVTHLHYDHAGNLDLFPNARFHLQDREMSYATGRCMCHGVLRHPFSVEHVTLMVRHVFSERVSFHSGDGEVAPGVTLHRVGGHSDGLQVVRVETARGPVVLASDASHYYANMHRRSPFPIIYNLGDMFEGWEIVERLAGHPDRVIPGHDPIVTEIYPRASDKVDAYSLHVQPSRSFVK